MVAEADLLPGDALAQLAAWDISVRAVGPGQVELEAGGVTHPMAVLTETQRGGTLTDDRVEQARGGGLPVLVTTPYVSSRMAARLRERGLNFVDVAGNTSIRLPGLVVEVQGRPREAVTMPRATGPTGRRAGVRVILGLLAAPERAGELTVREVAAAAGVSVGSAQGVLADLREDRFLYDGGLDRTAVLFEGWLAGYLSDRRIQAPSHTFTYASGWHEPVEVRRALAEAGAVLGGEDAATELGLPLRGSSGIVYASASPGPVVRAARLRKDPRGTLQVRDRWWRPAEGAVTAPSPLVYADLLASDDPRQAEVAAELRRTDALLRRLDAN